MDTITEQFTESVIVAKDLVLDNSKPSHSIGQSTVFISASEARWEPKRLEELINDAERLEKLINDTDSQINALIYFFFGSKGKRHVSSITSTVIHKLN
jgi:hypothetical protein